uniref:Uncharacterized protein n=1 Tax=Meloidogyne enterolobii TaxID=390850 RepID=A0A6V7V3G6_MELEN|nr:unnamed protein product [Meloidogyne enterolobii]
MCTPFIKTETKTLKWLSVGILPEDGPIISRPNNPHPAISAQVPFILNLKKFFPCFLPAQRSLPPRLVARSIQPFSVVAIEPTLCLFPNPSRLFSVFPYPTTSFTSEQRETAYFGKLDKPASEDFDLMSEWLDSGSDILASTKESILDFNQEQQADNASKSEKIVENDKRPEQQQPLFYFILNPLHAPNNVDNQKSEHQVMEQSSQQHIGWETGKDNALGGNIEEKLEIRQERLDLELLRRRGRWKKDERPTRRRAEANPTEIKSEEPSPPGPKPPQCQPLPHSTSYKTVPQYTLATNQPIMVESDLGLIAMIRVFLRPHLVSASAADVEKNLMFNQFPWNA